MRDFAKYRVWNESQSYILDVYHLTARFPNEEKYIIVNQLRRASNSIAANFAEGCGRSSDKDFARFLEISLGSVYECKSFLFTSRNLGYVSEIQYSSIFKQLDSIGVKIAGLIKKIRSENRN